MDFIYKYQTVDGYGRYMWAQKVFKSQADLFKYLVEEREEVFAQKKSITKRAEGCLSATFATMWELPKNTAFKAKPLYENNKEAGTLKRTILANTYWWLDSHSDVHLGRGDAGEEGKAVFTNSIKGREHKIPPVDQHNWSLDGKMGKTLKLYEAPISWRALGVGKTGMTEGLFAEAEISRKKNERRYEDYLNDEIDQHSVGMNYVDIQLAVNDQDEYPKEFAVWQKYIGKLGNRAEAERKGYFFAVAEAKLSEYSAVIAGSNELTPTMGTTSRPSGDAGAGASGGANKAALMEAINKLSKKL